MADLQASDAVIWGAGPVMPGLILIPKLVLLSWHIIIIIVVKDPLLRIVAPSCEGGVADPLAEWCWLQIHLQSDALLWPRGCAPYCKSAQSGMLGYWKGY